MPRHPIAMDDEAVELRRTVLDLLKKLKPPVHVAALSMKYAQHAGKSIKHQYKGGMLKFLKHELTNKVVLMGEGNDSFVRVATATSNAAQWVRDCIRTRGPILASMVGRLYHDAHGSHFGEAFPEGLNKFMRSHLASELSFEAQKGQEVLVDLQRRGEARAFLAAESKKQRKQERKPKRKREDGDDVKGADDSAAGLPSAASTTAVSGRLGKLGMPQAYALPSERLLVLGEADFSWASSLLPLCDPSERRRRLTTTSYDSKQTLCEKYGAKAVEANVAALKTAGASVLHGIDATRLADYPELLRRAPFDLIVFVFPHAGGAEGLDASIQANRELLRTLLREQSGRMLAEGGEVHVTLVHRYPYTAWLTGLTSEKEDSTMPASKRPRAEQPADGSAVPPLAYLGAAPFEFGAFGGYQHRATSRVDGGDGGALDVATRCLTHVWRRGVVDDVVEERPTEVASSGENTSKEGKKKKKKKTKTAMA